MHWFRVLANNASDWMDLGTPRLGPQLGPPGCHSSNDVEAPLHIHLS